MNTAITIVREIKKLIYQYTKYTGNKYRKTKLIINKRLDKINNTKYFTLYNEKWYTSVTKITEQQTKIKEINRNKQHIKTARIKTHQIKIIEHIQL